jgi:broad specificity phosphatase PhoE
MSADVLWARHGENVANLTRTLSYRVFDGDLTDVGRRQARELGERLAVRAAGPVRLLACSPLRRARQTADIVGQRLGLPVAMELDDLREVNVGELDGRSDAQAWEIYTAVLAAWRAGIYTAVLAAWRAGDTRARFPDGENRDELCARLLRALTEVARSAAAGHPPVLADSAVPEGSPVPADSAAAERSLVVAHGANLRAALPCLAGEPDPGADLPTGGVAALQVHPGGFPVVRLVSWPGAAPG